MKNKFLGMICIIYSFIIIGVIVSDKLKNYLAPNMQIYIKIAALVLLIIGFIIIFSKKVNYKFKITDLVLLIPIIMIIFAGDGKLSNSIASNRMNIKIKKEENIIKEEKKEEINKEEKEETVYDKDNLKIDFEVIDENYYSLADFISYPGIKTYQYENKIVKVKGFTIMEGSYIPEGYFTLGKYTITCCAADAEFAGFYVKKENYDIKDGAWYELIGVLEESKYQGITIMTVKIIDIKEINQDAEEMYVYPCYSYGDGSCKEFTKYNLKH